MKGFMSETRKEKKHLCCYLGGPHRKSWCRWHQRNASSNTLKSFPWLSGNLLKRNWLRCPPHWLSAKLSVYIMPSRNETAGGKKNYGLCSRHTKQTYIIIGWRHKKNSKIFHRDVLLHFYSKCAWQFFNQNSGVAWIQTSTVWILIMKDRAIRAAVESAVANFKARFMNIAVWLSCVDFYFKVRYIFINRKKTAFYIVQDKIHAHICILSSAWAIQSTT